MSESEPLNSDDVVRVDRFVLVKHSPFLGTQFVVALQNLLAAENASALVNNSGVPCEVLKPGESWQKGKLRIRLEFVPDAPAAKKVVDVPNSLDEFRQ